MITSAISQKLNKEVKTFIIRVIYEILEDPDFGLVLSAKAKKRLTQSLSSKAKTISLSQIKKKYY